MSLFGNSNQGFGGGVVSGGGGGGTVTADNITIVGDGSVGDPLTATSAQPTTDVDLNSASFPMSGSGIYFITPDNSSVNGFEINTTGITDGERLVLVVLQNSNQKSVPISANSCSVVYQGTEIAVTKLASGTVYEFIYNATLNDWNCLAPMPYLNIDMGDLNLTYEIKMGGFYYTSATLDPIGSMAISFPTSGYYEGQRIVVWNYDTVNSITLTGDQPVEPDTTPISTLAASTISEFISIRNNWVMISQR
jgi:hypothetical protein